MLGVQVWGQSGATVKEQGCHVFASEYRAQRSCQRGLCASGPRGHKSTLFFARIVLYCILLYYIVLYSVVLCCIVKVMQSNYSPGKILRVPGV